MKMPGQAVLDRVADMFEENPESWYQGWGLMPGGEEVIHGPNLQQVGQQVAMCTDVAIQKLGMPLGGEPVVGQARRMVYNYLDVRHRRSSIFEWNDASGRTVEEVVATLRAASRMGDSSRSRDREPMRFRRVREAFRAIATKVYASQPA